MQDLIPPHGGLKEPVDRTVSTEEIVEFRRQAAALKRVMISDADLSSLYRIGDGGLSPLTGPMDKQTWDRVLDEEVITHNGKAYAWTIPLAFPVEKTVADSLKKGETVTVKTALNIIGASNGTFHFKIDAPFGRHDLETVRGMGYRLRHVEQE